MFSDLTWAWFFNRAFLLGLFFISACLPQGPPEVNGTLLNPPMELPNFQFGAADGPVQISDYAGKFVVLAFGYTYCPDACPTTMARLTQTMKQLDDRAGEVQVALVTVDPHRDTPDKLKTYVEAFNPSFKGLSISAADSASFFKTLGIYHEKTDAHDDAVSGNEYLVDHTTSSVVLDRNGNWRLVWNFEVTPAEMAADLRTLIDKK